MPRPLPEFSFDTWFQQQRPHLVRLARSRLGDRAAAEDVVQEAALALWRRLDEAPSKGRDPILDPAAYLARTVWRNAGRHRSRQRDWDELDESQQAGLWAAPLAEDWAAAEDMEEALARLPAAQQAVVRLRYYAGLTLKETAATLAIGLNTAASRCRYALDALRGHLSKEDDEHGNGKTGS